MFNKLKKRFLILNLVIISVMMLISFTSIYLIIYGNIQNDINMRLHKILESGRRPIENKGQIHPDFKDSQNIPSDERSVSFYLIADKQWNIVGYSSAFNMDSSFYTNAVNAAVAENKEQGTIKLEGNNWAYIIKPAADSYLIIFLDISPQQGILMNMIYTFVIAALVMLIVIFFISRFFAGRSIEPIKEAFDRQKQFIADASHELKTPLAVINTNVDVLLSNGDDTINNQSKWLNYIKSESERMAKLTNDLLYLTQMDYADVKMIFSDFTLSEAVESVILAMEAVFFENNISCKYDIEADLITHGNMEQIKQVVMILLDNALKYTNANGSVDITLKRKHNEAVLSVSNTGEGIAEEHLGKIFDRFYRTDKSRSRKLGGYGLGLAIAKTIVDQHKGKIYVKSVINEKTTFYVELPLVSG